MQTEQLCSKKKPQQRVLILNASHNDMRLIWALKELGYYVITIGNTPGLIGEKYADEYIQQDYSYKDAVLELARSLNIDAICSCCNDFGVLTAAYVAEELGLPGHDSYSAAKILHHKNEFKVFAREHQIKTPLAEVFSTPQDAFTYAIRDAQYPLMVKASDLSAGNGITRVDHPEDVRDAINVAFEKSRIKQVVIEPFIEGSQHAICTFLVDQKVVAAGSNNEYSWVNPYRVEVDTYPADHIDEVQEELIAQIEKMAKLLHLKDGIFEMQYHYAPDGQVWIMECMRRVLGNLYGIPASRLNGFNWDYWEARAHCGLSCANFPKETKPSGYYAYRSLMAAQNGEYVGIEIDDDIKEYIFDDCMLQQPGYCITKHLNDPMGFFFFEFPNKETMDYIMKERYEGIRVVVLS